MDPITASALIGGGTSILGGLFGSRSASKAARKQSAYQDGFIKRQRDWNLKDQEELFSRLGDSAEKGGFNRLTGLALTGGAGFGPSGNISAPSGGGGHAPLASISAIVDGVRDIGDVLTGKTKQDAARQEIQDRLQEIRLEQQEAGGAASIIQRTNNTATIPNMVNDPAFENVPAKVGMHAVSPQMRPTLWSAGSVPVFGPDGGQMQIPKRWAERLNIQPWDAFIVGDYEEILGDEFGQFVAALKIPSAATHLEGGLVKQRSPDDRARIAADPFNPASYFNRRYPYKPKISRPSAGWMDDKFGKSHAQ